MVRETMERLVVGSALVGILLQGTSCATSIGFGIGAMTDARNNITLPKGVPLPATLFDHVRAGTSLMLTLTDRTRLAGTTVRPTYWPAAACSALYVYAQSVRLIGRPLPTLGDTVTIVVTSGERVDAQFVGWSNLSTLTIRRLGSAQASRLPLAQVRTLRNRQGVALEGNALAQAMALGARSSRVLLHEGQSTVVALDRVAHLEVTRAAPKHGIRNGLLVGVVIDLMALFGLYLTSATGDY